MGVTRQFITPPAPAPSHVSSERNLDMAWGVVSSDLCPMRGPRRGPRVWVKPSVVAACLHSSREASGSQQVTSPGGQEGFPHLSSTAGGSQHLPPRAPLAPGPSSATSCSAHLGQPLRLGFPICEILVWLAQDKGRLGKLWGTSAMLAHYRPQRSRRACGRNARVLASLPCGFQICGASKGNSPPVASDENSPAGKR